VESGVKRSVNTGFVVVAGQRDKPNAGEFLADFSGHPLGAETHCFQVNEDNVRLRTPSEGNCLVVIWSDSDDPEARLLADEVNKGFCQQGMVADDDNAFAVNISS
jgi:hypothetical protein